MEGTTQDTRQVELINAIKNSIGDARHALRKLAEVFTENVQSLRLEESNEVFVHLTQNIDDLQHLLEYVSELNEGIKIVNGLKLPLDPITLDNAGLNLFKEMVESFEGKDWVMLSDLIEYELSPLLLKEDEWLGKLDENITAKGTINTNR